jgi:hypothetical protein
MKKIRCLLVVLLAMSIQFARGAEMPAVIDRPITGGGPTQVSVGIWIVDISNIDSAQQTFTAEVAVVLRWKRFASGARRERRCAVFTGPDLASSRGHRERKQFGQPQVSGYG